MIPTPETLIQQQKHFFGKLSGLVFESSLDGPEKNKGKHVTTSVLIQLHSRVTTIILLSGLLLLSANEYFGEAINCLQSESSLPKGLLEKYCWFEGNFVFYDASEEKRAIDEKQAEAQKMGLPKLTDQQAAYPGVSSSLSEKEQKIPLKYYQWVYFVLIIQVSFKLKPN